MALLDETSDCARRAPRPWMTQSSRTEPRLKSSLSGVSEPIRTGSALGVWGKSSVALSSQPVRIQGGVVLGFMPRDNAVAAPSRREWCNSPRGRNLK